MMSGTRIKGFRGGWALKPLSFGKAHYFERKDAGLAVAVCGAQDAPAGWLLGPGDWTRCARCERILAKRAEKSEKEGQDARNGSGL